MSVRTIVILLAALLVSAGPAHAQANRIHGRVVANPPVPDPIDVVLHLIDPSTGRKIKEIVVDAHSPRRFSDAVPGGTTGELLVRVVVSAPQGYVPSQDEFLKRPCCALFEQIHLKRRPDLLMDRLQSAAAAGNSEQAVELLESAVHVADTFSQKLEVQRQLAQVFLSRQMFKDQQEALDAVYELPEALEWEGRRKETYWQERLDGLLLWTGYNALRLPEQDFAAIIASEEDPRSAAWKAFLEDFRSAYPGADVAQDDTLRQFRVVTEVLGRRHQ